MKVEMMPERKGTKPRTALNVIATRNVSDTWVEHLTFSHNGRHIAVCSHTKVYICGMEDLPEEKSRDELCHEDIVWKSVFSQNDATLFTCCADECFFGFGEGVEFMFAFYF